IVAVGPSVVRALEHAATEDGVVRDGHGLATGRLGASSSLRVVDALLTGTHERGTSHHELLRAFVPEPTLDIIDAELDRSAYRTHEFGDSLLIERAESTLPYTAALSYGLAAPRQAPPAADARKLPMR